jgi:exosortase
VVFHIFKSSTTYEYQPIKRNYFSLLLIVSLIIAHKIFSFWGILLFEQFSFYFLWLSSIVFVLGVRYTKHIIFPLSFFIFAVPIWEFFVPFFVELTTLAVTIILSFSDLTVFIHGNFIEIPYGIIEVAKGCSGIRYFEIGLALAVLTAHDEKFPWRIKLLVILIGAILGIITNWIRVLSLIYIGYWSEMTSSLMKDHEYYGFLLFFIVISGLFFIVNRLRLKYPYNNGTKPTNKDPLSTHKLIPIGINNVIILTIMLGSITFFSSLLVTQNKELTLLSKSKNENYYVLSDFGIFDQKVSQYYIEGKQCEIITRSYDFVEPGGNVLPYDNIYDNNKFKSNNVTSFELRKNNNTIKVNKIELISQNNKIRGELFYWYEFNNFHINNKRIAKLFEIIYLAQLDDKMKLNAIWCSN